MSYAEKVALNLKVAEAHFAAEAEENMDKIFATYTEDAVWEAPARDFSSNDKAVIRKAYEEIFAALKIETVTPLKQFANDQFVTDDRVIIETIVNNHNPWGVKIGDRIRLRLVHILAF